MEPLHNSRTALIAICATVALLCASCATSAVREPEQASPQKRSQLRAALGTHALFRGDLAQAVADLRGAIELDSKNVGAINNLGLAYWQLGKKDLAKAQFMRALELDSENGDANINMGTYWTESGNLKLARQFYARAADNLQFRMRHRALTNLAEISLRENKTDEARQLLYQSLQVNPEYCLSHYLLGTIYLKDNNPRAASASLKKSVRNTCTANIEARYQLAMSYMRLKSYEKARSELKHLIENYPQTKQAQAAADLLKALP